MRNSIMAKPVIVIVALILIIAAFSCCACFAISIGIFNDVKQGCRRNPANCG